MRWRFWFLSVKFLSVLAWVSIFSCGWGPKEIHAPATTFVFPDEQEVREPRPSSVPYREDTGKAQEQPSRSDGPARLTLLGAITEALKQNQKIQVSSYNPQQAAQDLRGAEAVYDSSIFASANRSRDKRPINSLLDTGSLAENLLIEKKGLLEAGAKKLLPTGGTVSVYQETDSLNSNSLLVVPNPQGTSRLVMELSQPLLKGFWDQTNRATISIARLTVDITNEDFLQTAMDVTAEVVKTYWQLVMEREFEFIARQTVEMAEEVFRRESARLERGISTQLDADRALAAVELRRSDLLKSQSHIKTISDQLKLLLNLPPDSPDIVPVEKPLKEPARVELGEAIREALKNRPELKRALNAAGVSNARKELADHNRLPKLNAVMQLTKNGLGVNPKGAFETVYTKDNNSWLAALEFEYPLGNQAARAESTKRGLEYQQAVTEARRVKDQVANEVSLAIRDIHLASRDIPTSLRAQTAAGRVVVSENARFELGQKTNEELLRAQDLLAAAAREYAQAVLNYNIALGTLARAKGTILKDLHIKIKENIESARPL
jgi:outer membrane protein TolC